MGIQAIFQPDLSQLGMYAFDVCANKLIGDSAFANIHGLPVDKAANGLSIEFIINRIVDGDRERTAKEVHTAILTGAFIQSQFRVKTESGELKHVGWFGRCLHDADGMPTQFTGGVFDQSKGFVGRH
ncbi:PAS domain-containing protein [Neorhizobium alkalisoli]|jgi:PAS domain-containing protein|uniref:PAS domain-containing protein n=1 Tax=Neorhizobium alkalisoli TaxID=528178 RepID=A0A561PUN2_9HYPH|nr:PAS domain-containing protein [Neorhizobium alkalisoli]TWF41826.1 PAS domain-containing protein [Neorhizobium alkalisoli]